MSQVCVSVTVCVSLTLYGIRVYGVVAPLCVCVPCPAAGAARVPASESVRLGDSHAHTRAGLAGHALLPLHTQEFRLDTLHNRTP